MTNVYYGETHTFTSRKDISTITLKAGPGETLVIDGYTPNTSAAAGINTSVQYNDNGALGGASDFTYDGTNLIVPNVSVNNVYGATLTNDLDYNEIYRGLGPQQMVVSQTGFPDFALNMGTDVSMARSANYVGFACPNGALAENILGGMSVWKESAGTFSEYIDLIKSLSLTTSECKFGSLNDDATLAAVTDCSDTPGFITIWKRVGTTWSYIDYIDGYACRISGDNLIVYDRFSNIGVYNRSGDTFVFNQYLSENNLPSNINLDIPIEIQGNRYAFMLSGIVEVWDYTEGSGFSRSYLASSTALKFAYSTNVLATLTADKVKIYENFVLTNEVSLTNPLHVTTNGTYVFVISTTGVITILHKSAGAWIPSVNTTTLSTGVKMSCNATYLAVGEPGFGAYGRGSIYEILTYNNEPIVVNTIDTLGTSNKLIITAPTGVTITASSLTVGNGTEAEPSINFASSSATGMYSSSTGVLDLVTAGTNALQITSGGLVKVASTLDSTTVTTGSLQTLGGIGVSKTVFATTFSSPNGAFKMNSYQATTAQSCTATVSVPILFGTDLLTGISTITKSTSGGGSRYTTSIACKLLVDWSLRSTNASNFGQTYLQIGGSGKFYGHCNAWAQSGQGNALSSSVILNLSVNDYFTIFVIFDQTCNISNDATYQISMLQIYSLN